MIRTHAHRMPRWSATLVGWSLLGSVSCAVAPAPAPGPSEHVPCSFRIGPEGRHIDLAAAGCLDARLGNMSLDFPPGAVTAPTELSVQIRDTLAAQGEVEGGPAIQIEPADLVLRLPVRIGLPYDPGRVTFTEELLAVLGPSRVPLENPLRRVLVGAERRPYSVSVSSLGAMQALIRLPKGLTGIKSEGLITDIDVLFVIDNSSSMSSKQEKLVAAFPKFIETIAGCKGVNIHVGIISTDIGTNPTDKNAACNTSRRPTTGGVLESATCIERSELGSEDPLCRSTCASATLKPGGGQKFIEVKTNAMGEVVQTNIQGEMMTDTPAAKLQRAQGAFRCMAYIGSSGCGIEQPFVAVERAIQKAGTDNAGFFRSLDPLKMEESALALIFLTDEDDCSLNQPAYASADAGILDPMSPERYRWFNTNMRCFAMGTYCDASDDAVRTKGSKTNCRPKSYPVGISPYLRDVDALAKDFTAESGGKYGRNVLIGGIWPKPFWTQSLGMMDDPYGSSYSAVELDYLTGARGTTSDWLDLKPSSCSGIPMATSYPQHRLSRLAEYRYVPASVQGDICDPNDYSKVLEVLGYAIRSKCPYTM
jgi:hypothetical protein